MARRVRSFTFRSTDAGGSLSQDDMRTVVEALRGPGPESNVRLEAMVEKQQASTKKAPVRRKAKR